VLVCFPASGADAAQPLAGETIDYAYDDAPAGARAYLHPSVLQSPQIAHPVVIYLHGVNHDAVSHRWMGGGEAPDLRVWWDDFLRQGLIEPTVLAAPSTTASCRLPQALWAGFDLDRFLAHTIRASRGRVRLDLSRVVVVGHSGAGCNRFGGLVTALQATTPLRGGLAVDVCMDELEAPALARARPDTDVVVTYQPTWQRSFEAFAERFLAASSSRGGQGLRLVQEMPASGLQPHTAIVRQSLEQWLPQWLPPHPNP
jgi:hypothetical protein